MRLLRAIGVLVRRHPFSLFLAMLLAGSICLWWRAGRHYDSLEFLTPKFIVTVHSEMRMVMITTVMHDDSSWEVFHNSDVHTVDAPWFVAAWPQFWGSPFGGEVGVIFAQGQLVLLLLLSTVAAFLVERRFHRRRVAKLGSAEGEGAGEPEASRTGAEPES